MWMVASFCSNIIYIYIYVYIYIPSCMWMVAKLCTSWYLLVPMKHCKECNDNGINHLPTGEYVLPSTVCTYAYTYHEKK